MLNEVSCWYIDWSLIGTWVGGVGSAGAAIAAIFLSKNDAKRRQKYSKFLLQRDLGKLLKLQEQLEDTVKGLRAYLHSSEEDTFGQVGLKALRGLSSNLEFFGRSERLFEYDSGGDVFEELNSAVHALLELTDKLSLHFADASEDYKADVIRETLDRFGIALKKFSEENAHIRL